MAPLLISGDLLRNYKVRVGRQGIVFVQEAAFAEKKIHKPGAKANHPLARKSHLASHFLAARAQDSPETGHLGEREGPRHSATWD